MASSVTQTRNRYTVTTILFLVFFLLSMFLFSRRALDPALSLYRDLFFQASPSLADPQIPLSDHTGHYSAPLQSSSNQSVYSDAQTGAIEPDSSTDSEIFDNDKNGPVSDDASTVTVADNARESSAGSTSDHGKNGPISDNESTSVMADDVRDSSTDSTEDEISDKDKNDPGSDNESTGKMADDVRDLGLEKQLKCDLYTGTWVKDENYPLYQTGSCPYVDEAYDCQINGRTDIEYTKWRWKPDGCDLPRFNATDFLVRLRGKKLMLVGDSMNRNQFESILCVLREGLQNKSKMYEVHGYKITKGRGFYVFKFEDYNCTVQFVRSHFLVKEGIRKNAQGNTNPTLSIDQIDKTSGRWKRADILVFNTGHWWTHGKTARGINYYKEGGYLYPQFDAVEAYRRALKTWATWIDRNINPKKQLVYYRGYSSAHFRGGDWDSGGSCKGETEPVFNGAILDNYPVKMQIVQEVIKEMTVPVRLLNVTRLTNFRKDGHPSVYGKNTMGGKRVSRKQDCSHWCLPGVPDIWNELIYATLVLQQTKSSG